MPFSDRVLKTKLQAPRFGVQLLERPRVWEILQQYPSKNLTLISAPAGYGKTVLISQFTEQIKIPTAWYHLDQFDNDLNLFIQHLLAGLEQFLPGVVTDMLYILEQNHTHKETRRIVAALINSLTDRLEEELLLVIDDYHAINENTVHEFIDQLLHYLPKNMHVFLASRTKPPLNLERLRIAGLIEEIDFEKLKFTREEITSFLMAENNASVSHETVAFIEEKTLGWPAAIRLAWIAMSNSSKVDTPELINALPNRKEIYNYLATEVLNHLPSELSDFVLSTSVLDIMTPDICDLFLEKTNSNQILEDLESRNLFVTAMEGEFLFYRYHPLFKEYLQSKLGEEQKRTLYQKGGYSYLQLDYLSQAIECFIGAGNYLQALSTIEKAGSQMLFNNRWQTVQRWLECIPADSRKSRPQILLLEGSIYLNRGWLSEAETLINEANSALATTSDHTAKCQGRLYQARALRSRGNYKKSLNILEQILPELSQLSITEWYDVTLEQSLILIMQGEFSKAMNLLKPALSRAEREKQTRIAAWLFERLGMLYYFKGEYSRSVETHQRAVEMAPKEDRLSFSMRDSMAAIYHDWGDLDQALDYAQNSITIKNRLLLNEFIPYAYSQLAMILASKGQPKAAEKKFRHSIDLNRKMEGEEFFLSFSLAFYSKFLANQGRMAEARSIGKDALKASKKQSEFIHAICKEFVATTYFEEGNYQDCGQMLEEALNTLEKLGAKYFMFRGKSYLAAIYRQQGRQAEADKLAESCLELAGSEDYLQLFISHRQMMVPVIKTGLIKGIALEQVYEVISQWGNEAEPLLLEMSYYNDSEVKQRAIQAMSLIEGEYISAALENLLDDPNEEVQNQSLKTLKLWQKTHATEQPYTSSHKDKKSTPLKNKDAAIQVQCLGPFRVTKDGKEVKWRTTKARELFAYLFHHREKPVIKDHILEGLWPDSTPERASTLFHTNLYHLRKALKPTPGKQIVKHKGKQYYLDLNLLSSDIDLFEALATPPERGIETETAATVSDLEQSISLYRGEYMEDLDYPWIAAERERLNQAYMYHLEQLANYYVERGDLAEAASCLKAILRYNPLLEDTHVLLMKVYARMGDRMAVMQQYQTLYRVLEREMGIEPNPKTKELYYELCSEDEQ